MERLPLQLLLLGVFSQIYPNSMESRLTPTLHAVPIESRSNSKKIYCFVPYLQQTYESEKEKSLRCDHFRNLFCRWLLFRFTATQDRPNLWGNTFFGRGTVSQILFVLFVCRKYNIPTTAKSLENNISCWGNIMSLDHPKCYFSMRKYYFSSNTEILFLRTRDPLLSSL